MILRRQRAAVYESKVKKEETSSSLEKENELNKDEVKRSIKASVKESFEENEKTFRTEDQNSNNEKLSLKLDSVKRISKFFEKDTLKSLESPKIDNKVVEKDVPTKRFEINPSPMFIEKLKTYQTLVKTTEETKKKELIKKNSKMALTNSLSEENSFSPEIISDLSKPTLPSSVEINEKTKGVNDKENSLPKENEKTRVTDLKAVEKPDSDDISINSSQPNQNEKGVITNNNITTSTEFKKKLKAYQALLQSSETSSKKIFKTKSSETLILNKKPEDEIANPEVTPSLAQLKELSAVEIDEKTATTATDHGKSHISTKSVEVQTVPTMDDLQEKVRADESNNIATKNKQDVKHNETNSDSKVSNNFKERLRAYQMLVQNSDEKNIKELKKRNSKITINNNLTQEKVVSSEIIPSPSKIEQQSSSEIIETTDENYETSSLKRKEAITSLATADIPVNEKSVEINNSSNIVVHNQSLKKDAIISNDTTVSMNENNEDDKPHYQNALLKDKSLFESRAASVKLIINQYQTSIPSKKTSISNEKKKPVLNKQNSQTKFLVTRVSEDTFKSEDKELVEERVNIPPKTEGPNKLSTKLQNNSENNNLQSESESVRIKKEVKFLKERKDTVENLNKLEKSNTLEESGEGEPKDEIIIERQEHVLEKEIEEDQPSSSIKDIIRKAKKVEAEKQQSVNNNKNKTVSKIPTVTVNNKSTVENKVDLNEELKKKFKSRIFNNEIVSSENFVNETDDKDLEPKIQEEKKNDSSKVFKYKIGQKSDEETISDWTPVNQVTIKTNEEIIKEKKNKNSEHFYKFSESEIEEITFKNTQMNAKTTTELKSILKVNNSQTNSLNTNPISSVKQTQKDVYSDSLKEKDDNNNNNKKNTRNLENFIAKHLEKQMQNGNNGENPKHGATRVKPTNRKVASEYFKNTDSKLPNGAITNIKSEHDYPEPDYD